MAAPPRILAFVLISAGLVGLALALAPPGLAPEPSAPPTSPAAVAIAGSGMIATAERRQASLARAARTFIAAFLRYEVGDLPPALVRSIRSLSTAAFGRYLLDARPRQLGARPLARIVEVETSFLDAAADRALVRGVARRADGPEELSFVFVFRGGRWLAAGAAE